MCGRFALVTPVAELKKRFRIKSFSNELEPRYNAAPGQVLPVVEMHQPDQLKLFKWGLVPHWAKDTKIGSHLINARAETLAEKPSFRSSLKKHRCLVPADGFYEWDKKPKKHVPYHIRRKDQQPFAFAGLCAHWEQEKDKLDTFTIITVAPNLLVGRIHDRMPAILQTADEAKWLDPLVSEKDALKLLKPYPADELEAFAVSPLINSSRNRLFQKFK